VHRVWLDTDPTACTLSTCGDVRSAAAQNLAHDLERDQIETSRIWLIGHAAAPMERDFYGI